MTAATEDPDSNEASLQLPANSLGSTKHPETEKALQATASSMKEDGNEDGFDTMNQRNGSVSSMGRRSRAACDRCRRRKTKCSGLQPCRTCQTGGYDCIYPRKPKRITILDVELEDYKSELEQLRNELRTLKRKQSPGAQLSNKHHKTSANTPSNATPLGTTTSGTTPLSKTPSGAKLDLSIWLGSASCELICWNLKEFAKLRISGSRSMQHNREWHESSKDFIISPDFSSFLEEKAYDYVLENYQPEVFTKDISILKETLQGLSINEATDLLDSVVLFINSGYLTIDPSDFRMKLESYFDSDGMFDVKAIKHHKNDYFLFQMLMILALGEVYSKKSIIAPCSQPVFTDKQVPGLQYFQMVLRYLPPVFQLLTLSGGSINDTIQVIELFGLIAIYLRILDKKQLSVMFTLNALELGVSIHLHKNTTSHAMATSTKDNPHYNKVWWAVYCLNRFYSLRIGQPLLLSANEITREYPQVYSNHQVSIPQTRDDFGTSDPMKFYIELAKIAEVITTDLYCMKREGFNSKEYLDKTLKIMEKLIMWVDNIPEYLRLEIPTNASQKSYNETSRLVYTLHLNYLHHIYLTCIPILINFAKSKLIAYNNDRSNSESSKTEELHLDSLPRNITNMIKACINASQLTINIFTVAYRGQLLRIFGFTDLDFLLSSALIFIICMILRIRYPKVQQQSAPPPFEEYLEVTINLIYELKVRGNLVASGKLDQVIELLISLRQYFVEIGYTEIYVNLSKYSEHAKHGDGEETVLDSFSSLTNKGKGMSMTPSAMLSNVRGLSDSTFTSKFRQSDNMSRRYKILDDLAGVGDLNSGGRWPGSGSNGLNQLLTEFQVGREGPTNSDSTEFLTGPDLLDNFFHGTDRPGLISDDGNDNISPSNTYDPFAVTEEDIIFIDEMIQDFARGELHHL